MRRSIWLFLLFLLVTSPLYAQLTVNLGGLIGYYNPALNSIHDLLEEARTDGAYDIQQPGAKLSYGFSFEFMMTPRVFLRFDASRWQTLASWTINQNGQPNRSDLSLTLWPVFIGFQLFLNDPEAKFRYYLGAGGGIIRTSLQIESDQAQSPLFSQSFLESSGSAFASRLHAGFDYALSGPVKLFADVAYLFGSFIPQEIDLLKSRIGKEKITMDGLDIIAGLKVTLK